MTTLERRDIDLKMLDYGHAGKRDINIRKANRQAAIPELAAMIRSAGLLVPLIVKWSGSKTGYIVVDGNRRLAAIRSLSEWTAPVPCVVLDGSFDENNKAKSDAAIAQAREVALMTAVGRLPMHPVDQFETFQALIAGGYRPDDIKARFSLGDRQFDQAMALAGLAPIIRDAWRADEIDGGTAKAFTLAKDIDQQEKLYKRLKKSEALTAYQVHYAIGGNQQEAGKLIRFVGFDAYVAAGGKGTRDLFGDQHAIYDVPLVKKLAAAKLDTECKRLVEEDGWAWAETPDAVGGNTYSWQTLFAKGDKFTKEQRARSGCIVSVSYKGELDIHYGKVKPHQAKAVAKAKAAKQTKRKTEPQAAGVSNNLAHRLSTQLTMAVQAALATPNSLDPDLGLIALLAGFVGGESRPLTVQHSGYGRKTEQAEGFDAAFRRLARLGRATLGDLAAKVAASTIDMTTHNASAMPLARPGAKALVDTIDDEIMLRELRAAFDADDFFVSAPAAFAKAALKEMGISEPKTGGKAALAKATAVHARATGWLPEMMRPKAYKLLGPAKVVIVDTHTAQTSKPKDKGPRGLGVIVHEISARKGSSFAKLVHGLHPKPKGKRGVARKGQGQGTKRKR